VRDSSASMDSIPRSEGNVTKKYSINVDSLGNELSSEQQEYFENSKVWDEEGRLKPLYHGTKNEFTVFDINKNHVITFGNGFYFEKR